MKAKFSLLLISFVLLLIGLFIVSGKFLRPAEKLNKNKAEEAMVLSYAESGQEISNVIRIAVNKKSDLVPLKLELLGGKNNGVTIKELPLSKTTGQWICQNPQDGNHDMKGFETEKFILKAFQPEKTLIKVTFEDNGTRSYYDYQVSDSCTRFLDNSVNLNSSGKK